RNVAVHEVRGGRVVGLEATGEVVRLGMVNVTGVESTGTGAAPDGAQAIGVSVEAAQMELNSVHVTGASGANAIGVPALAGAGDARLVAVGVHAEGVEAEGDAIGILIGSAAGLDLRGFVVNGVRGTYAAGVLLVSGRSPTVSMGRVTSVAGSAGASAGARLLG